MQCGLIDGKPVPKPSEVFTLTGFREGEPDAPLQGAYVVGADIAHVTDQFAQWGFTVVSIASLDDVDANLQILRAIADSDPQVTKEEYLDLLPPEVERTPERLFTFVGQRTDTGSPHASSQFFAGFAAATDAASLSTYLAGHGFHVTDALSYAQVQSVRADLARVAAQPPDTVPDVVYLACA